MAIGLSTTCTRSSFDNSEGARTKSKIAQQTRVGEKAEEKKGGSRLVANAMTRVSEGNDRSCLCDAIISILPSNRNKWLVGLAITLSMPKYGDTSVLAVLNALVTYALKMKRVNGNYIKKGEHPITFYRSTSAV